MMDNRTIIAVVLIVLLWSGYSLFFSPQPVTHQTEAVTIDTASQPRDQQAVYYEQPDHIDSSNASELYSTIDTPLYQIQISSNGASVKSLYFKNYREVNELSSDPLFLLSNTDPRHYTFKIYGSEGFSLPDSLHYTLISDENTNFKITDSAKKITWQAEYNNLNIIKSYTFYPDSYHVNIDVVVINNSSTHHSGKLNISLITPWSEDDKGDFYTFVGPLTFDGKKLEEDKPKNIKKSPKIYRDFVWTGFTNKYFLQALYPHSPAEQVFINSGSNFIENIMTTNTFVLTPSEQHEVLFTAYLGPKKLEYLSVGDTPFDDAIHFGFFHFLAKPLFDVLRFFNSFLNNYGFSIILLTVCIKLIFWPLTQKSYKSMQGMQKLQPEMKRLKEKYADDKQRLNQEMMSFYKDNKVNPLGGCLPILIQIPVFFALYKVLLDSIELRHAPFILWISDLSAKDPYYITPIIMGASMFLQQKLTPTNMDPTQEKIMLMMPVIFTFMFLNFPSGLVLYWLVNNLLTILQQLLIRRQAKLS